MTEKDENIDEIRRDIEDTRMRISSEIDAIEGKLTPGHAREVVMEKVNEKVSETRGRVAEKMHETRDRVADRLGGTATIVRSGANRVGSDFGTAVRTNPLPVALIGIGAGWLVWETLRPVHTELEAEPLFDLDVDVEPDYAAGTSGTNYAAGMGPIPANMRSNGNGHRATSEARAKLSNARDRASGLASDVRGRASSAKDRASHLAHDAKDRASHLAHDAKDRASHLAHDAKDRSRMVAQKGRDGALRARDVSTEAYDANPIAFGALALALGVGVGLLLPHTRREDRALGRARQRVVTKARHMADEAKHVAIDSVREGANAARETAKREAEERNLIR
ncbi:MAG: DUF3618 domain-containing protein [Myxococcota bacterium]|nr:DUF3618 domain-containing protein [Myxococcota bacterium]